MHVYGPYYYGGTFFAPLYPGWSSAHLQNPWGVSKPSYIQEFEILPQWSQKVSFLPSFGDRCIFFLTLVKGMTKLCRNTEKNGVALQDANYRYTVQVTTSLTF